RGNGRSPSRTAAARNKASGRGLHCRTSPPTQLRERPRLIPPNPYNLTPQQYPTRLSSDRFCYPTQCEPVTSRASLSIASERIQGKGEGQLRRRRRKTGGCGAATSWRRFENPAPVFVSGPSHLRDLFHPVRTC